MWINIQDLVCFVYVYAVYTNVCIFIGGTVNGIFYRSFVRVLVVGWWAGAAGSGSLLLLVGVILGFLNLKESRTIKFAYTPLKLGGILHFFGLFRWLFSLRLVHLFTHNSKPYRLHHTYIHLHTTTVYPTVKPTKSPYITTLPLIQTTLK